MKVPIFNFKCILLMLIELCRKCETVFENCTLVMNLKMFKLYSCPVFENVVTNQHWERKGGKIANSFESCRG